MAKLYIADTLIGSFALDEEGNIVVSAMYPKDIGKLVEELANLEQSKPSSALRKLVEELSSKFKPEETMVVIEDPDVGKFFSEKGFKVEVQGGAAPIIAFRDKLPEIAVKLEFAKSEEEYKEFVHRLGVELTRRKLRGYAQKRDLLAIQAIRAIDDIDKTLNLFAARLREWYSIHFPELDDLVKEHDEYARIVAEIGLRDDMDVEVLKKLGISEGKAKRVLEVAKKSIGADLSEMDVRMLQKFAGIWLDLHSLRQELTEYVAHVMREVAPNITALVGPLLGARLLSLAGSLEELAKLPASTIQVLGAEKALFRALRTGGKPPKHGVIFQFPEIRRSPRWQRGKIARALATKLAIAARVDYFTGRYIGDELKKKLMERIEEIKKLYPKPPKREEKEKRERKVKRRGGRRRRRR
ncbi:MAG: C/D box methylation guide ribonucleoprotein complex aNOP56 subunit [Thermoprotei archaeon]|nr:MAG: C/D box methylation guide ribonucleoprotein complex aNOP56 subunit [Thermoprotei archaeon]